jgi:hypothetical protein
LIEIRNEMRQRRPLVMLNMIYMPQNAHEVDLFRNKWKDLADTVSVSGIVSRIGSVSIGANHSSDWQKTPCVLLWKQLPILSDGTVGLCCDDWNGAAGLGNLKTTTIKEVWASTQRQRQRRQHLSGRAAEIPLCEDCRQPRSGPWWFAK